MCSEVTKNQLYIVIVKRHRLLLTDRPINSDYNSLTIKYLQPDLG
jgi:hypothetical protein